MSWEHLIRLIQNGEAVEADVANRAPSALANRTQFLYDLFTDASLGEALFLREVTVESTADIGDAVYYDDADDTYKLALAAVEELDGQTGLYVTSNTAHVVGIVYEKHGDTIATLVTGGTVRNLALGLDTGPYYLSADTPGQLVAKRPHIGVYVLYYGASNNRVHVSPTPKDLLESHIHYKFELESGLWDDGATAYPHDATWGYNVSMDTALNNVWPPIPVESSFIEVDGIGATSGDNPRIIVDHEGIWWVHDGTMIPTDANTIVLWFTRMVFKTDAAMVTSLDACDGSPIEVLGCTGDPATRGRLCLDLDLAKLDVDTDDPGVTAIKGVANKQLQFGPVVTGIQSDSNLVVVTSDNVDGDGYAYGRVTVEPFEPEEYSGPVSLVALNNVKEEYDLNSGLFYLYFPEDRTSSIRGRIELPHDLPAGGLTVRLWCWFISRGSGGDAQPSVTFRYLSPSDEDITDPTQTPDAEVDLGAWSGAVVPTTANDYIRHSLQLITTAERGATIFFTLSWDGTAGPTADGFGILRSGYAATVNP